ncbi:MAG TPA: galactose-1-epimerase, partial [Mariniphaga anaerophila]|nr:galactose-1-epimerase [Mariniphaga anaerophila]
MIMSYLSYVFVFLLVITSCSSETKSKIDMPYSKSNFEGVINGKTTRMFTMENENGMVVTLTNYGAKIVSVYVVDKKGNFDDVLLGFNSIDEYQMYGASHGAVVGPFANRIANAR